MDAIFYIQVLPTLDIDLTDEMRVNAARDEWLASLADHRAECQCAVCYYGRDAYIRNFHPGEY